MLRIIKVTKYRECKRIQIVGIGEFKISRNPKVLATYALGSCIAIIFYSSEHKIGALVHAMLPWPRRKIVDSPGKYVSTAIPYVLRKLHELGVKKNEIEAALIGGANVLNLMSTLNIGERNIRKAKEILAYEGVPIVVEDVGGRKSRSVYFDIEKGIIYVTSPNRESLFDYPKKVFEGV